MAENADPLGNLADTDPSIPMMGTATYIKILGMMTEDDNPLTPDMAQPGIPPLVKPLLGVTSAVATLLAVAQEHGMTREVADLLHALADIAITSSRVDAFFGAIE